LNGILKIADGDTEISKILPNIFSGYLGTSIKKNYKVGIKSDMEQVWNWLNKKGEAQEKYIFVKELETNYDKYFMYGQEHTNILSEINIPMDIQMKDFANMRSCDMIKKMGGTLAYRKVHCMWWKHA
jgi:hypothetical protein